MLPSLCRSAVLLVLFNLQKFTPLTSLCEINLKFVCILMFVYDGKRVHFKVFLEP